MIKGGLFLILLFCKASNLVAQSDSIRIFGKVYEQGSLNETIENAKIVILHEMDTLAEFKTDSTGSYKGKVKINQGFSYSIKISHKYYFESNAEFLVQKSNSPILFDTHLTRKLIETGPLFYKFNKVEMEEDFDFELLHFETKNVKNLCFQFVHFKLASESFNIANERIEIFKEKMLQNGFKSNEFSIELKTMDCINKQNCKATTEGVLNSVENNCY